jgi:hypothetical protein
LGLGESEVETWESVCAIEWYPEPETPEEDAEIGKSVVSTTESRQEEPEATEGFEWFEWPEEPEIKWFEEPEESAASAGIREAVKYLLEDAFEGAAKATGAWAERGRTDPWRSGGSFAEWQARVAAASGKLAGDLKKLEDVSKSWRRQRGALSWLKRYREERRWRSEESFAAGQSRVKSNAGKLADDFKRSADDFGPTHESGGVLKWWRRDREEKWRRAVDSWKRHRTPGEMRKMWIRRNRGEEEAARAWRVNHGGVSGGERDQNSTEARTLDQGASRTSRRDVSRSLGTAE